MEQHPTPAKSPQLFFQFEANLRLGLNVTGLMPPCPFWLSFVGDHADAESFLYQRCLDPNEILSLSSEKGLKDCDTAIFSNSEGVYPWLVHVARDSAFSGLSEGEWLSQVIEQVGLWKPESIGFSFPKMILSEKILGKDCLHTGTLDIYMKALVKLIYGLVHAQHVKNYYFFTSNQSFDAAFNFLLLLKSHLHKAKISSIVLH